MHPPVAVLLCTLLYRTVAAQHEELTNEDLMELEAQRKDEERQEEEEVTEEPKRFTTQEMARGFSLFEEALLVLRHRTQTYNSTRRLQQPFRMQSSATVSSMTRKKELLPRHRWIAFSRR